MSITLTALMKQRYDTAANWTAQNPTLLAGEFGIESDTKKWKVGTGATAWTSLLYSNGGTYPLVNADIAAGAEIAVSKLADGSARQLLQTDAAGTGVEWTSDVSIPGVLAVTAGTVTANGIQVGTGTTYKPGIYSPSADTLAASTAGSERVRLDSSGRLLVGTATATQNTRLNAKLAVVSTGDASLGGMCISSYAGTTNVAAASLIDLARSRGTTDGSMTAVESGDYLGYLLFRGSDGTNFIDSAHITCQVDATTGANDMPGRLVFSTTPDGSASPLERFRIGSAGQLGIGGATYGTSGQVLTSGGASAAPSWGSPIGSGTAVASTSGTSIDFTSIPSYVKKITVMFNGVSLSSVATLVIQLGVGGTAATSGYVAGQIYVLTSGVASGGSISTSGFVVQAGAAAYTLNGSIVFNLLNASSYIWTGSGVLYNQTTTPYVSNVAGVVTLSGVCNMVRITSTSTDTFDAGSINILYE